MTALVALVVAAALAVVFGLLGVVVDLAGEVVPFVVPPTPTPRLI